MVFDSLLDAWGIALGLKIIMILWDVLVHSGLITLSIAALFISKTKVLLEQGYSDELFNSVILELTLIISVWAFAVLPWATLEVSDIKTYYRACETPGGNLSQAIRAESKSPETRVTKTFEGKFDLILAGEKIQVPPLVYATLSLSQGFKNEAVSRLPCATDIQLIESTISNTELNDHLLEDVNEFVQQCYSRAVSQAYERGFSPGDGIYPEREYLWPGYPFFFETDGFYGTSSIYNFEYALYGFSESVNGSFGGKAPPGYGVPTCREWWLGIGSDSEYALRNRLYAAVPNWIKKEEKSFYTYLSSWFDSKEHEESFIDRRDAIVKRVFFSRRKISDYYASHDYGLNAGDTNIIDYAARAIGTIGVALNAIPNTVGNSMIQLMAPMVKPLIILIILTAYIPAMVIGRFRVKHVTTFLTVIASIMFWPFLWEIGRIVDDTILEATGGQMFGSMGINQAMLSQYLAGFFFLYGPMLFTAAMGWVGMAGGEMASAKQRVSSSAGSSGQKGVQKMQQKAGEQLQKYKKIKGG